MSKKTNFKILRDVFHVLSYASKSELLEASQQPQVAANIAKALENLALEAGDAPRTETTPRRTKKTRRKSASLADALGRALAESPALREKEQIVNFAKQVGIKLNSGAKDSRARVLSRLSAAVDALPDERKAEVSRLLQGSKLSEIEGWIEVIKKPRN